MKRLLPVSNRTLCAGLLSGALLISAGLGCEPPPDTSPAVSIISPAAGATLQAGQPIPILFTISGKDSSGATPLDFKLVSGSTKIAGQGKVRAFIDNSNFLAQTAMVPDQNTPFNIPDPQYGVDAATIVTKGTHRITLQLYYNNNELVAPQRQGTVTVTVQ
jgi:hypothetical protein